jgi:hypothetical protein
MSVRNRALLAIIAGVVAVNAQSYSATYDPNNLPPTTEQGQTGTNECGTGSNQTSQCQNLYVNSVQDFCLWGPPEPNSTIGVVEQIVVAYCTQGGRGTRVFPAGTITSAHFIETPDYIQVTGNGVFTQADIQAGDEGGELDPHGADGFGNPHGGLVFSNVWDGGSGLGQQIHEWTNFMADTQFCIRVCKEGPNAPMYCQHVYDIQGCMWNMPGNYSNGFDNCLADDVIPMGLYPQPDGSTSTYVNGAAPTPAAQNPAATSSCTTYASSAIYTGAPAPTGVTSTRTATPTATATGTLATTSSPRSTSTSGAVNLGVAPMAVVLMMFATMSAGLIF